jgi:hypothetical protein
MSIADVDAALRDLDQTITRRNTNLDAFMRDIGQEINHILDQLAECDRAVASGLAPPADLQRIRDEIRRLITEVERIPLDDAKKDEILTRLRREYQNRSIRRSAPYSSAPGPSSSSSSVSPAPGARSGVFSGFNLFSSPSSAPGSSSSPVPGSSSASPSDSASGLPSVPKGFAFSPPAVSGSFSSSSPAIPPLGSVEMGKVKPALKTSDMFGLQDPPDVDDPGSSGAKRGDQFSDAVGSDVGGKTRSKRKRKSQKNKKTRR